MITEAERLVFAAAYAQSFAANSGLVTVAINDGARAVMAMRSVNKDQLPAVTKVIFEQFLVPRTY